MGVNPRAPHGVASPGRFRPPLFLDTETDAVRFRWFAAALLVTSREYPPPPRGRRMAATSPPLRDVERQKRERAGVCGWQFSLNRLRDQ